MGERGSDGRRTITIPRRRRGESEGKKDGTREHIKEKRMCDRERSRKRERERC